MDRSVHLHELIKQAEQKFDYFIVSVSGALFAYLGNAFHPQSITNVSATAELFALFMFSVSFICGVKNLEISVNVQRLNKLYLSMSEDRNGLKDPEGKNLPIYSRELDSVLSPQEAKLMFDGIGVKMEKIHHEMQTKRRLYDFTVVIRNWSLIIGFVLLCFSKVYAVYLASI